MNKLTIMAERFETVARLHQLTQAAFETLEDLNVEDLALLNRVNGAILIGALHPVWADDQSLTFFEESAPALYEFLAEHVQIMGA